MSSPSLTGLSPNNPTKYTGARVSLNSIVVRNRIPTTADVKQPTTGKYYPFGSLWLVGETTPGVAPVSGNQGDLWYLGYIAGNMAYWFQLFGGPNPSIETITGDDGVAVDPDVNGNFNLLTAIVANGTNATPLFTENSAANTERIDLQLSDAVTPTPVDNTSCGISCFNDTQFTVDATSGMVSLIGSTADPAILTLTGDTGGPISPDVNGNVSTLGGGTATGIVTAGSANQINHSVYRWVEPISANWVPVVEGITSAGVGTYVKQHGVYGRIGNIIFFTFDLQWSAHTGTGNMRVSGFPKTFTKANSNYPYAVLFENITLPASTVQVMFNGENNQTYGDIIACIDATTRAPVALPAAGTLACYGFYFSDQA